MHDIVEISEQPDVFLWWQWALIALAAAVVLTLIFFVIRRLARTKQHEAKSPLEIAVLQLSQLDAQSANSSNQLAVQLSLIVRHYLQRKFNDQSLFMTHEEFHTQSTELSKLPKESSELLHSYLTAISEHKYAPNANHPAALESMIEKASKVVHNLENNSQPLTQN